MIDTHLHLDDPQFDPDRTTVVERALQAGVTAMVTLGIDLPTSVRAVALAEQFEAVYAAVGIHPNQSHRANPMDFQEIARLARHPKVVAIGECGLDYVLGGCPPEAQRENLRRHVGLANELGKPIVIHNRKAHEDLLQILQEEGVEQVVMHAFTGPLEHVDRCAALGYWMGVGGVVTYPNADDVREAVRRIPDGLLLVETDAPHLAPHPHRGKRNEPAYLPRIVEAVAAVRGQKFAPLAALVGRNAQRCFGL